VRRVKMLADVISRTVKLYQVCEIANLWWQCGQPVVAHWKKV